MAKSAAEKKNRKSIKTIVSGRMIAAIYHVSLRAVQQWVNEKNMPRIGKDKYDLAAIVPWWGQRIRDQFDKGSKDEDRLIKAQADEREEKAALAKMDVRVRQGELLEKIDVERGLIDQVLAVKTAMKALSITLSKQLIGVDDEYEIERIVAKEIDQALNRFANNEELTEAGKIVAAEIGAKIVKQLDEKGWLMITEVNVEIERVLVEALS